MMNKYLEFFKMEIKEDVSDRSRFFVWTISKPIMMLMQMVIWTAVFAYSSKETIGGFSMEQTINYFLFQYIFGSITYAGISEAMGNKIFHGNLVTSLLKPINLSLSFAAKSFGGRLFSLFYESIPSMAIGMLFFSFKIYDGYMIIISIISLFGIIHYFIFFAVLVFDLF